MVKPDGRVAGSHFYRFEEMGRHMRADAAAPARMPAAALAEIAARRHPMPTPFRLYCRRECRNVAENCGNGRWSGGAMTLAMPPALAKSPCRIYRVPRDAALSGPRSAERSRRAALLSRAVCFRIA